MKNKENDIIASLMANRDFKDWIFTPTEDRNLYWQKWIKAHPEHKEAVQQARNYLLKLKFRAHSLENEELEEILNNIISNKQSVRNWQMLPTKHFVGLWLRIAATILLILSSIYIIRYTTKKLSETSPVKHVFEIKKAFNPEGRRSKITLPDGTIVRLNAESTLLFPEEFSDSLRVVELSGEAFFDVVRDESRPFIVKSNNLAMEVLGTSFNVRAFDDENEINISLVSGKVRVFDGDRVYSKKEHILVQGEKLTYDKMKLSYTKSLFDVTEETGWKDEILVFKNTDFPGFVKQLERWYGIKINVVNEPNKTWRVNGHFDNESLEEVLIGVQFTYDIEYKIENKSVTLNCK